MTASKLKLRVSCSDGAKFLVFVDSKTSIKSFTDRVCTQYELNFPHHHNIGVVSVADENGFVLPNETHNLSVETFFDNGSVVKVGCYYTTPTNGNGMLPPPSQLLQHNNMPLAIEAPSTSFSTSMASSTTQLNIALLQESSKLTTHDHSSTNGERPAKRQRVSETETAAAQSAVVSDTTATVETLRETSKVSTDANSTQPTETIGSDNNSSNNNNNNNSASQISPAQDVDAMIAVESESTTTTTTNESKDSEETDIEEDQNAVVSSANETEALTAGLSETESRLLLDLRDMLHLKKGYEKSVFASKYAQLSGEGKQRVRDLVSSFKQQSSQN